MLDEVRKDLKQLADPEKAKFLARFFKTGKGEYGEGDIFLGLTVPQSRRIAIKYKDLPLADVTKLLSSKFHEERLIALLILVHNFSRGTEEVRKTMYDFYLVHTQYINNWDLVDLSADKIVGEYLCHSVIARSPVDTFRATKQSPAGFEPSRGLPPPTPVKQAASFVRPYVARNDVLYKLAHSQNLWEKRIAIVATFAFIKQGSYEQTFAIAEVLLYDKHDLIQKAVGWMLREVGKRVSEKTLEEFLQAHYRTMPRTALRYAIERFPQEKKAQYMKTK